MNEILGRHCTRTGRLKRTHDSAVLGFDGGIRLLIACAYRLEKDDSIVATTGDQHAGLAPLVGRSIVSSTIDEVTGDAELRWDDGSILRLFCDVWDGSYNFRVDGPRETDG